MSSEGGGIGSKILTPSTSLIDKVTGNLGSISDRSTRGLVGGSLAGAVLGPVGVATGALKGKRSGEIIEEERAATERAEEESRQQFNTDIFQIAQRLQGRIADNPDFDFESLRFIGDDPRQEQLKRLVQSFTARADEVSAARFEPGLSQTRLSLVE